MVRRILRGERKESEALAKYVYCVIPYSQEKMSFGNLGFDGGEVYTIDYRDMAPVVSDVTFRDYAVNEEEVEVHRKVNEAIMKDFSVIPVAYGMAFKSRKLLQIAMSAGYPAMQKALQVVDGTVELGIKVFLPKELEAMDPAKRDECSADFIQNLLAVSSDWKKLKLFSDRLILNAAFLVDKSSIDEFSENVGRLTEKYNELKVQYSGPWPAYNFVDIHILGGKRRGFR
ncbi:Gas vesicle synthesis protein GvpL/GvpF [uncultured archaeon]|nr:Gas vesicle synthesis protein GvpL/GvpF [uncultured archaeon]